MKSIRYISFLILAVTIMLFTQCEKEYDRSLIGFYVEDTSELPVYVNLGTNNRIDTITAVQFNPDCGECYVQIELINDHSYDLIMYGKTQVYEVAFYVPVERCKTIKFMQ